MPGEMIGQSQIVSKTSMDTSLGTSQVSFFKSDGTAHVIPERAAARANVAAMTQAAITGGESPTEAEFNALRVDVAAIHTAFNDLLAKLRTANVIAT